MDDEEFEIIFTPEEEPMPSAPFRLVDVGVLATDWLGSVASTTGDTLKNLSFQLMMHANHKHDTEQVEQTRSELASLATADDFRGDDG